MTLDVGLASFFSDGVIGSCSFATGLKVDENDSVVWNCSGYFLK